MGSGASAQVVKSNPDITKTDLTDAQKIALFDKLQGDYLQTRAAAKIQAIQRGKSARNQSVSQAADLQALFAAFNSIGARNGPQDAMDGAHFKKFCKDCKAIDKKFTSNDIDLTFAKFVTKGQRRLTFEQFKDACAYIAEKRGMTADEFEQSVLQYAPAVSGTKAEANKFHDDKTLYHGTHAHGGPESVAKGGAGEPLANLLDRGTADVRGVPT